MLDGDRLNVSQCFPLARSTLLTSAANSLGRENERNLAERRLGTGANYVPIQDSLSHFLPNPLYRVQKTGA